MKALALMIALTLTTLAATPAYAVQAYDSSSAVLGSYSKFKCGAGLTCAVSGGQLSVSPTSLPAGIASVGSHTRFPTFMQATMTAGTSTTPSATTVYLVQVFVPVNVTLTGFAINNAGTCGTNKYVAALFSASGAVLANSALAGTLCSGTSAYQNLDFTATYAAVGPGVYWIGLYVDGTTDRFYSVPAAGAMNGLAGSATGQTFGTVAAVTLPTTFTADKGPVGYLY